ncbi:PREDICTED: odorant receptor 13a-like [Wasmannia auropunctata]|uniref:odorant receptor 13a-like n=1 Tax=Wasmannia auropunctata TaxID=64793 RepID=UPI0005ED904C|nr:PREDICTED: odorant receptor 13a-like [Wasmannia auropunctata]
MERQVSADKEYYDLIKPIMVAAKFISIWPLERDHSTRAKLFKTCHVLWLFFTIITTCAGIMADLVHNFNDLDELTACALMASAFSLAIIRLIIFTSHQKDMLYVVETMRKDWTCSSYEDRVILKQKCLFAFQIAKYFAIMVTVTIVTFTCIPILEVYALGRERIFPFRGYFFVNQSISPIYECLYVFNVTGGSFSAGTIVGATTFNLVATTHGSAKFAVLRKKLEAISSNDPNADRAMANCIKDHQNAITFADTLERIVNILALGQFVISTGLVCFAGFQITSMMKNKARLMEYSMFLNAAILELFMFSFSGNALIDESDAVGESAYCSHWIGGTFGRSLQIVMMRSKVPSRITAAKFYSMSLESFAQVLSTSFSYIIVLMTANEE